MKTAIILPEPVRSFMAVFTKSNFQIYIVGGPVRDLILGRTITNWDLATNASPQQIQKLFKKSLYNNKYGTVTIPVDIGGVTTNFEVTPFRKESDYEDLRHPKKIEWAETIEEDLVRRDFTINALAFDGKKVVDIVGGTKDLGKKLIRAVGEPNKRFGEDALRLLRSIRFAAELEFLVETETRDAIINNAYLIEKVSWERIRDEFLKIIGSPNPSDGILFLKNTNLLKYILPEVETCFQIPQKSPKRHHIFDVGTHLVQSLKYCPSKDPITRFATLIHDIGKAETYAKDEKTGVITFYNHEVLGAKQAGKIADRFRLSKEQKKQLVTLVGHHMFSVSEYQTDRTIRRFIRTVGQQYLDDILGLRVADRLGSGATQTSWRTERFKTRLKEVQKVPFQVKDLKIDGHDVMKTLNIKPGPKIGDVLQKIFDEVDEGGLKNERGILLKRLLLFSMKKN